MKRLLSLAILLFLLPLQGAFCLGEALEGEKKAPGQSAENAITPGTRLYTALLRESCKVYSDRDGERGINWFHTIRAGARVSIYKVEPAFVLISYENDHVTGYISREGLTDIRTVNPANTPPFGVEFNHFIASVGAIDAPVTSLPGGGDLLITLHRGARISFIGFENGYGKVIFHRVYGYVDSRLLKEITPVYERPEAAGADAPIASYTSFYKITTDQSNLNRMVNIAVACRLLEQMRLPPKGNLNFNRDIGPYTPERGYLRAGVLTKEGTRQGYGGGTCQVSSTLYNVVLQLPDIFILQRSAHGYQGVSYLPIGVDAAVGNNQQNFRFRNDYAFPLRIEAACQDGALTIAVYKADAER